MEQNTETSKDEQRNIPYDSKEDEQVQGINNNIEYSD